MASDSDGTSDSSAVILRSIREKLVEYKESLLRQLVDEQEAALAAEKERDEAEDKDKSVVEETEAHDAELEQVEDAETVAGFKQDGGVDLVAEESPVGNEEEDTAVVCEKPREKDAVLKKRRLEDAGSPVVAEEDRAPVKKAKRGKTKTRKPAKNAETSVNSDASTFKTGTTADGREMQETLPPLPVGIQYRV
ncbi:hypothetical protein PHYBOEH_009411 [Phytophthora boehmeriae]|uniref:Uncharacterized protein n=1 Tax=Phytophthora boehmeriae TaxID=109152 RepID=A0A8T1VWH2_9STRA|nr:hypothetical protein PHYBOEH_009411 [Phytophthora boehmeriae]